MLFHLVGVLPANLVEWPNCIRWRDPLGAVTHKPIWEQKSPAMATEHDIERFIGDSFSSIWDLELLSYVLQAPNEPHAPADLVGKMRASELVVSQGIQSLVAAGIAYLDDEGRLLFQPVNDEVASCARQANDFYARFPGRTRRLMISRLTPGLNAFADAFRLRKD